MTRDKPALWTCPDCGERFTTRNQWHSCGTFDIDTLFERSQPHVRRLFDQLVEIIQACGPVTITPQKTRIVFQVRMRFAAVMPQRASLKGHLVLAERQDSACFERVDTYSPRNHVHVFRLESAEQLNAEFCRWVDEAYRVGQQKHLDRPAGRGGD
ncbi:MAG: DUF5655 domain-containing protein [Gemmatimonadales bacterium]